MELHRSFAGDAALPAIRPSSSDVRACAHTHTHTHARGHGHTVAASGLPMLPMLPSRQELQEERRRRRGHITHMGSPTKLTAVSPSTMTSRGNARTPPSTGRAREPALPPVTLAVQFLSTDDEQARRQALLEQTERMWRARTSTRSHMRSAPQRRPQNADPVPAASNSLSEDAEALSLPAGSISHDYADRSHALVEPRKGAPVYVAAETQTEDADRPPHENLMDAQVGTEWDLPADDHFDAGFVAERSASHDSSMLAHSVSEEAVQPEAGGASWDIEDGSSGWSEAAEDEWVNATKVMPAESGGVLIPDVSTTDEKPPSTEIAPEHNVDTLSNALALDEGGASMHGPTQESSELTHDVVERVGSSLFSPTSSVLDAFVDDEHIIASPQRAPSAQQADSRQPYDVAASVSQEPTYISSQTDDRVSAQSSAGVLRTPSALSMKPRRERDASQTGLLARMRHVAVDDAVASLHRRRLSLLHMTEAQPSSSRASPVTQRVNYDTQAGGEAIADNSPGQGSEDLSAEPLTMSRQGLPNEHITAHDPSVLGGTVALSNSPVPEDRHGGGEPSPNAFSEHVEDGYGDSPSQEARGDHHEDELNEAGTSSASSVPEISEGVQSQGVPIAYSAPPSTNTQLSAPVDDSQHLPEGDDQGGHVAASAPELVCTSAAFVLPRLSSDVLEAPAASTGHLEPMSNRDDVRVPALHAARHTSPSSDVAMLLPSPDTHDAAMSLVSGARDLVQRMRERGAMPPATQTVDALSMTRRVPSPLRPTTAPASTTRAPADVASRLLSSQMSAAKPALRPATTRSPVRPAGIRSPEKGALLSEAAGLLARMGRDVRGAPSPLAGSHDAPADTSTHEVDAAVHKKPSLLIDDDLDSSHDSEDIDAFHLTLRRLGMSYGSSAIPEFTSPVTDLPDTPSRFPAPLSS